MLVNETMCIVHKNVTVVTGYGLSLPRKVSFMARRGRKSERGVYMIVEHLSPSEYLAPFSSENRDTVMAALAFVIF